MLAAGKTSYQRPEPCEHLALGFRPASSFHIPDRRKRPALVGMCLQRYWRTHGLLATTVWDSYQTRPTKPGDVNARVMYPTLTECITKKGPHTVLSAVIPGIRSAIHG